MSIKTHSSGDACRRVEELKDYRRGRRLLRPSTHTQAKYHQPHRSGVKPTYGALESSRGNWSTVHRRSPPEESAGRTKGDQTLLEGEAD